MGSLITQTGVETQKTPVKTSDTFIDVQVSSTHEAASRPDSAPEYPSTHSLIVRYNRHHDPRLREELILNYEDLVRQIATRFVSRGEPLEDLLQAGTIGLIKAVDRFDPSRNLKFSTYAVPTIVGEIKRHLRDHSWQLNVCRRLKELYFSAINTKAELAGKLGRSPSIAELAHALGVTKDELVEALGVEHVRRTISSSSPVSPADGTNLTVEDSFTSDDPMLTSLPLRMDVQQAVDALAPRMRSVIVGRYFEGRTQLELGQLLHISQMQVSRLHARALRLLKDHLMSEDLTIARLRARRSK